MILDSKSSLGWFKFNGGIIIHTRMLPQVTETIPIQFVHALLVVQKSNLSLG